MRKSPCFLCLALLLAPLSSVAKVEHTLRYTKNQTYQAALRHLRVDARYTITEKDSDSGYLLFEYPLKDADKTTSGSIEIVERKDSVALIVNLPELPQYHERMLAQGLLKKLRDDYGEPPRAKEAPPKKETPEKPENSAEDKKKFPSPKIQRAP